MRLVDYLCLVLAAVLVVVGLALVAPGLAVAGSGVMVGVAWFFLVDDA